MANRYAGTKTEKNLWDAFAGESMARNKYNDCHRDIVMHGFSCYGKLFIQ